jgi:hypothetical protein
MVPLGHRQLDQRAWFLAHAGLIGQHRAPLTDVCPTVGACVRWSLASAWAHGASAEDIRQKAGDILREWSVQLPE